MDHPAHLFCEQRFLENKRGEEKRNKRNKQKTIQKRKIPLILYLNTWKYSHFYTSWKSSPGERNQWKKNSSNDHIRKHHLKPSAISSVRKVLIMLSITYNCLFSLTQTFTLAFLAISIESPATCLFPLYRVLYSYSITHGKHKAVKKLYSCLFVSLLHSFWNSWWSLYSDWHHYLL